MEFSFFPRLFYRFFLPFLALFFSLPSCVQYEESIVVREDGKVEFKVFASFLRAGIQILKTRPEFVGILSLPLLEGDARTSLLKGAEVKRWLVEQGDVEVLYDVEVTFPTSGSLTDRLSAFYPRQKIVFYKDEGGTWIYRREIPPLSIREYPPFFQNLLKNREMATSIRFHFVAGDRIEDTNGFLSSPEEVVWETDLLTFHTQGIYMFVRFTSREWYQTPLFLSGMGILLLLGAGVGFFLYRKNRSKGR